MIWVDYLIAAILPFTFGFAVVGSQGLSWIIAFPLMALVIVYRRSDPVGHSLNEISRMVPRPLRVFVLAFCVFGAYALARGAAANPRLDIMWQAASFLGVVGLGIWASWLAWQQPPSPGRWYWLYFPIAFGVSALVIMTLVIGVRTNQLWLYYPLRHAHLFAYNRVAVAVALCWPVAVFALLQSRLVPKTRNVMMVALTLAVAAAVAVSVSTSAKLSLAVMICIFVAAHWRASLSRQGLALVVAIGVLGLPAYIGLIDHVWTLLGLEDYNRGSFRARLSIWISLTDQALSATVFGHGLETARSSGFFDRDAGTVLFYNHPHSAFVQVWLDLGMIGAALLVSVLVAAIWLVDTTDKASAAMYLSLTAGIVSVWAVSHGMWQTWYPGLCGVTVMVAVFCHRRACLMATSRKAAVV